MKPQDVLDLFAKQVADLEKPFLWDSTERFQYLVDAQDTFVRRIGGIADASTRALTDLAVTPGVPFTAHSPYVLRIRSAKLLTAGRKIDLISEADISSMVVEDYGFVVPQFLDDSDVGEVRAGVLGVQKNQIRWYRVPNAADICRLNVFRLPYPRLKDEEGCFEIDEQHHMHLILWMKHLAYAKEDAETYDKELSESNRQAFEDYCSTAKQEEERQRYKPRTVRYGGIRW